MIYENVKFISSEILIAEIKQRLRLYFESGALNELLINTYIDDALRKLGVMALQKDRAILVFQNYRSKLPDDFYLLSHVKKYNTSYTHTGTVPVNLSYWYKEFECENTCEGCQNDVYTKEALEMFTLAGDGFKLTLNAPESVRVYFKSNIKCVDNCENLSIVSDNVINIDKNNNITSTFEEGCLLLDYYRRVIDEEGFAMIPEIIEVEEYIKSFVTYKFFEDLWHSVVDESSKQIGEKLGFYAREYRSKYEAALAVYKMQSTRQVVDGIVRRKKKFFKYHIR